MPENSGFFGSCVNSGDATWSSSPQTVSGRAKSVLNISMNTKDGKYCGVVTTDKETRITAYFTSAPDPDFMSISGQNRDCTDSTTTRVVERLIEFYY